MLLLNVFSLLMLSVAQRLLIVSMNFKILKKVILQFSVNAISFLEITFQKYLSERFLGLSYNYLSFPELIILDQYKTPPCIHIAHTSLISLDHGVSYYLQ